MSYYFTSDLADLEYLWAVTQPAGLLGRLSTGARKGHQCRGLHRLSPCKASWKVCAVSLPQSESSRAVPCDVAVSEEPSGAGMVRKTHVLWRRRP